MSEVEPPPLTQLSPAAKAALEELLKDDPRVLLQHRCCLLFADAAEPAKILMQDHPAEVREAIDSVIAIAKRYARAVRETATLPPQTQATLLVALLLNRSALMLISEE